MYMGFPDLALRAKDHRPTSKCLEACVCMGFSDLALSAGGNQYGYMTPAFSGSP